MFAPEELADFREIARMSLPGRCDVTRKVRVKQPNGTFLDTVVTLASNIECRKTPSGNLPIERVVMQTTLGQQGTSVFILASTVDIHTDDSITYPTSTGKKYGVAGIADRTDGEYVRAIVYDDGKP